MVSGEVLASEQAEDAASLGPLPAAELALVREHAGRAELAPAEWIARAIRAYAQVPASAAQRQRAARERKRLAAEQNQPKEK